MKGKTPDNPLELRPGARDRFFAIWDNFLDAGDTIAASVWTSPAAVDTSAEAINATPLTLDSVVYAAERVSSVIVENIDLNDLVEIENEITSASGRVEKQSLWLVGVGSYSD